ncbi:hypothetical protein QTO34_001522 [Cnephaeus nilssonii]|uniref:C-CAP/cofactor C-like domain-containing protein n=1 Tax=Cnephaeus nilssonii TaxID=3371016 RepID=A0AA40HWU4_CNENI|nr:hypothetical protein QTO34_001522 [Eptesicus nilssonii]
MRGQRADYSILHQYIKLDLAGLAQWIEAGLWTEGESGRERERQREISMREKHIGRSFVKGEKRGEVPAAHLRKRTSLGRLLEVQVWAQNREQEAADRCFSLIDVLNPSLLMLVLVKLLQRSHKLAWLQTFLISMRQIHQWKQRTRKAGRRKEACSASKSGRTRRCGSRRRGAESILASPPSLTEEGAAGSSWLCGFSNLKSQVLEKRAEELHQRDVLLTELSNCTIKLYGNPNTLRLSKARGCTLLCGPVSTSVFLDDCSECVLAVACQQLRVHTTRDTRVFLQVTCRAIVEDCHGIQFAPYTWSYPGIDRDFESSGLDRSKNNWNDVDDFNWLARDMASPNWSVLPEEERTTQWD